MTIKQNGGIFGRNPSFKDVEVGRFYFDATKNGPEITIASGAVTVDTSYVRLDTENNDATDDLDTINGGKIGQLLILRIRNSARAVVVKDQTGNLDIAGDFNMNHSRDCLVLLCIDDGGSNDFIEIARSNNNG